MEGIIVITILYQYPVNKINNKSNILPKQAIHHNIFLSEASLQGNHQGTNNKLYLIISISCHILYVCKIFQHRFPIDHETKRHLKGSDLVHTSLRISSERKKVEAMPPKIHTK